MSKVISKCIFCGKETVQDSTKIFLICDCLKKYNKAENKMDNEKSLKNKINSLEGDIYLLTKEIIPKLEERIQFLEKNIIRKIIPDGIIGRIDHE